MSFSEKGQADDGWINGGFFVLVPGVLECNEGGDTVFEREHWSNWPPQVSWYGMASLRFMAMHDTLRDLCLLERIWQSGRVAWKNW